MRLHSLTRFVIVELIFANSLRASLQASVFLHNGGYTSPGRSVTVFPPAPGNLVFAPPAASPSSNAAMLP